MPVYMYVCKLLSECECVAGWMFMHIPGMFV